MVEVRDAVNDGEDVNDAETVMEEEKLLVAVRVGLWVNGPQRPQDNGQHLVGSTLQRSPASPTSRVQASEPANSSPPKKDSLQNGPSSQFREGDGEGVAERDDENEIEGEGLYEPIKNPQSRVRFEKAERQL